MFYGAEGNPVLYSVISIAWYILMMIGLYKMFTKAGVAGWKAIVPIYNFYILFQISWKKSMFWILALMVIGGSFFYTLSITTMNVMFMYLAWLFVIIAAVMKAVLAYNVSLAYGHGLGYFLGLYLFDSIFIMILGFGSSRYVGNRYEMRM